MLKFGYYWLVCPWPAISSNLGIYNLQNPEIPRKFLSCFNILVRGNIEMGFILLGIKALDPSGGIRLRCFIEGLTQLGFVLRNLFMFSLSARKLRRVLILFQWSSEREQRKKSSTYCRTWAQGNEKSDMSLDRAWPNKWWLSLNPWGRTVYANWVAWWEGFSKAKRYWESGCRGMQKKVSFKSKTMTQIQGFG